MLWLRNICWPVISRLSGRCGPLSATFNLNALEIPKMNTLAGLPVELLLSIADFLPMDDWICISLCNHRLFAIFNRRYNSARPLRKMKLPVLRRLERDLPEYFICYVCFILHKYDGSECFGLSGPMADDSCPLLCLRTAPLGLELNERSFYWRYIYRRFYFLHLQLVMRRFYLGEQYGISTNALSYTQVRIHPEKSSCPEITSLFSTDAQICSETPGLCLRMQNVIFVHNSRSELLLYGNDNESIWKSPRAIFICMHVGILRQAELLKTVLFTYLNGEKHPCFTGTCNQCNTDIRIEVCGYGSHLALVLTTWINLGAGLTPEDPRWKIHSCENWGVTLDPNDRTGSPRVSFENASPQSLGELLSRNLSYLKDRRYRKFMRPLSQHYRGQGLWYLPSLPSEKYS